jgi:hypothetical protein
MTFTHAFTIETIFKMAYKKNNIIYIIESTLRMKLSL